jgi:Holliday junction resolvasome RuvABC endonuclease subunit
MKRVLAADASTTTIGLSILDYDPFSEQMILVHSEVYKPNKKDGVLEMLLEARKYILDLADKYSIEEFAIEDYVRFMKGQSGASTVIPLAILNMTLRLAFFDKNIPVFAINVLKIRHSIKLSKELPKKEEIPELVAKILQLPTFPYIYKTARKTKEQKIAEESYDMADAIAVSISHAKIQNGTSKPSKGSKKKK